MTETADKSSANQLACISTDTQALAVRSATLVTRGLRDLARDSNWLIKKVFAGSTSQLVVSPAGEVCTLSPLVRHGTERIALYDIERGVPTLALVVPGEPDVCPVGLPAAFAWSPSARHLVAAWGGWLPELHVFDLHGKVFLGGFGDFKSFPANLAWAESGKYFAAASRGGTESRLRLWPVEQTASAAIPFAAEAAAELRAPGGAENWLAPAAGETESANETGFAGFGRLVFSPSESILAVVAEIEGDWADDSIVLVEVPHFGRRTVIPAQGRITDLAWTPDNRQLIYCSGGQAYRVSAQTRKSEPLPFGAELAAVHPHLPLALCFSSLLKNSAKGRLFLADLNRLAVFDEYAVEGVVDIRWSLDGSRAYAVTTDGLAYIYEPPLL
jgi:WD40 repeat protein